MIEFRPGCFARVGETITASDDRRWFFDRDAWRRADVPLNDAAMDDPPPPELSRHPIIDTWRR